jgi:hypothetical protein
MGSISVGRALCARRSGLLRLRLPLDLDLDLNPMLHLQFVLNLNLELVRLPGLAKTLTLTLPLLRRSLNIALIVPALPSRTRRPSIATWTWTWISTPTSTSKRGKNTFSLPRRSGTSVLTRRTTSEREKRWPRPSPRSRRGGGW